MYNTDLIAEALGLKRKRQLDYLVLSIEENIICCFPYFCLEVSWIGSPVSLVRVALWVSDPFGPRDIAFPVNQKSIPDYYPLHKSRLLLTEIICIVKSTTNLNILLGTIPSTTSVGSTVKYD